jgi:uncharacterized RDD family membrane protein YckC
MLGYKFTSSFRRSLAFLIDFLLMIILSVIFMRNISVFVFYDIVYFAVLVFLSIIALYHPLSHCSKFGATVGQRILGMRILHVKVKNKALIKAGEPVSFLRAFLRFLLFIIIQNTVIFHIISLMYIVFTKTKQSTPDLLCKTIIVDNDSSI